MNATDNEGTAILEATAADVDESADASAVIRSDTFMARQQEEAAKRAGHIGRYHRNFPHPTFDFTSTESKPSTGVGISLTRLVVAHSSLTWDYGTAATGICQQRRRNLSSVLSSSRDPLLFKSSPFGPRAAESSCDSSRWTSVGR